LLLFRVLGTSVGTHEASWDESEEVLTYENTELRMDQIPSLLESEYQGCSQLLYDDLMLGLKSLRRIEPHMMKDDVNVDTVRWITEADILHRQLLNRLIGTLRSGA
jgi:hypothetical protein